MFLLTRLWPGVKGGRYLITASPNSSYIALKGLPKLTFFSRKYCIVYEY